MPAPETLLDIVEQRAADRNDAVFIRFLESGDVDGAVVELSYATLLRRAHAIGAALQQEGAPGDRVLLLYPSGVEFVAAFFGCVFAGMIPVPAYPPDPAKPERGIAKLCGIAADCVPRFALTTSDFLPVLMAVTPSFAELAALRCLASDTCSAALASSWSRPDVTRESIALLQYTSGSTAAPKGVVVRHHQLLANGRSIEASMGPTGVVAGWLPVFHDMGLIGNVLQVLTVGSSLVLMSPLAFLKRPARWLEAISRHRAMTAGGPNFAYDLCVRRITDDERARLDLSSWEVAFCGAEPVREATLKHFCDAFAARGFRRSSFFPCYGLAEATLFVAGNPRGTPPRTLRVSAAALERGRVIKWDDQSEEGDARTLVSCGVPWTTEELRIVDPERCALAAAGVGEIWVRGPGVASGYWGREEESRAVFGARLLEEGQNERGGESGARPFLRTGDLGFVHEGLLFVAGRHKELIILGGRNLFPLDVENTIEAAAPAVRKGCCVAFSVERDGAENLVVVAELAVEHLDNDGRDDVVRTIKRVVAEKHQAALFDVVLVEKGIIPKTSSGKLERIACRRAYLAGAWPAGITGRT